MLAFRRRAPSLLACTSFCLQTGPIRHRPSLRNQPWDSIMRRRRKMKPAPVRQATVSKLKQWPYRSSILAAAVTVTAIGFLLARVTGRGIWQQWLSPLTLARHEKQRLGRPNRNETAPVYAVEVVSEYDHDLEAFTQGLLWHDGYLYESTGLNGRSSVRRVGLETGAVLSSVELGKEDFGEGLCLSRSGTELVQVLWKTGKGYIYDVNTLKQLSDFKFEGDGWGLASSSASDDIYLSDGSSRIRVYRLNGWSFVKVREFDVYDGSKPVGLLNELEIIGDELWANVLFSDFIARIDMQTGRVKRWMDLRGILDAKKIPSGHSVDVLNGIAYDVQTKRIFVTGKLWPKLFSIQATQTKIADDISTIGNAFFLSPVQVKYVHDHLLA